MDYTKLDGLIPAVIQDDRTGEVLMVGFMNQEALERTRASGFATFFSRTRGTLWTKGESSGEVLMVGFMNDEALARTRDTGFATFFSRTRNALWTKGETSGNRLQVSALFVDCDDDTVLLKVKRLGDGNVCHTGERSCFYRAVPR